MAGRPQPMVVPVNFHQQEFERIATSAKLHKKPVAGLIRELTLDWLRPDPDRPFYVAPAPDYRVQAKAKLLNAVSALTEYYDYLLDEQDQEVRRLNAQVETLKISLAVANAKLHEYELVERGLSTDGA